MANNRSSFERCDPGAFRGPRAYFTSFDHRIVRRHQDQTQLENDVTRKLKALLLSKSFVVCAASHLTSDFTYSIFKSCPRLLTENHVIPALRADKINISDLFERDTADTREDKISFYSECVTKTVRWDLKDNSGWFRNRFISEIEDVNSLIRSRLNSLSLPKITKLISEVKEQDILSRNTIEIFSKNLPRAEKEALLNYRELIYHLSGARAVNCEGCLPQEEYIDYDLTDIRQQRVKLTELEIMAKLLIETILDSFQKDIISTELLDKLSFDDIIAIRVPLTAASFQTRYDTIISGIIGKITGDKNEKLLDLHELETIRKLLQDTFNDIAENEMPKFLKKKTRQSSKRLLESAFSVALGLLNYVPYVGPAAGATSLLKDTRSLIFNVNRFITGTKSLKSTYDYVEFRSDYLKSLVEKWEINDKTVFTDFVELLCAVLSEKYKI